MSHWWNWVSDHHWTLYQAQVCVESVILLQFLALLCWCSEPRKTMTEFSAPAIQFYINLVVVGKGKKVARCKQHIETLGHLKLPTEYLNAEEKTELSCNRKHCIWRETLSQTGKHIVWPLIMLFPETSPSQCHLNLSLALMLLDPAANPSRLLSLRCRPCQPEQVSNLPNRRTAPLPGFCPHDPFPGPCHPC